MKMKNQNSSRYRHGNLASLASLASLFSYLSNKNNISLFFFQGRKSEIREAKTNSGKQGDLT